MLLNEINSIVEPLDPMKCVVNNVQNVTLLGLKRFFQIIVNYFIIVLLYRNKLFLILILMFTQLFSNNGIINKDKCLVLYTLFIRKIG